MREIVYRLDVGHNFLKIDASENFYLRPNGDNTQKVFMLPQSYTINCRRLLLRESSLNPQWFLDLLFYVDESDTRKDSEILEEFFKFSSYDVAFDADNVSSSGQNVFVSGVNGDAPYFAAVLNSCLENNQSMSDLMIDESVDDKVNLYDLKQSINSLKLAVNTNGNDLMCRDLRSIEDYVSVTSEGDFYNIINAYSVRDSNHSPLLLTRGLSASTSLKVVSSSSRDIRSNFVQGAGVFTWACRNEYSLSPSDSSHQIGWYTVVFPSGRYIFEKDYRLTSAQSNGFSGSLLSVSDKPVYVTVISQYDSSMTPIGIGYNYGVPKIISFSDLSPMYNLSGDNSILWLLTSNVAYLQFNSFYPLKVSARMYTKR